MKFKVLIFMFLLISASLFCHAQRQQDSSKRSYNLFNPTPKNRMRGFETDRPDVTESPYTVDAGHFQYEADIYNYAQSKAGRAMLVEKNFNTANIKLGITNSLDFQLVVNSFVVQKITEENISKKNSGLGGVTIRAKQNIEGNDSGKMALAILPFVELPSKFLGGKTSGGLIIPFSISLSKSWDFGTQVEADIMPNEDLNGYHFSYLASATISHALFGALSFFSEGMVSRDSEIKNVEYFVNGGLVYALAQNINADAGVYYGLKKESAKNYFLGLSFRF